MHTRHFPSLAGRSPFPSKRQCFQEFSPIHHFSSPHSTIQNQRHREGEAFVPVYTASILAEQGPDSKSPDSPQAPLSHFLSAHCVKLYVFPKSCQGGDFP